MLVRQSGRLTVVSEMHPQKARLSMLVRPAGRSIVISVVPAKAPSGTLKPWSLSAAKRAACAASNSEQGFSPSPRTQSRIYSNPCVLCRFRTATTSTTKGAASIRVMVGNRLSASATSLRPRPVVKRKGFRSMSVGSSFIPGEKHREQSTFLIIARQLELIPSSSRSSLTGISMSSSGSPDIAVVIACSINWSTSSTTFTSSGASEASLCASTLRIESLDANSCSASERSHSTPSISMSCSRLVEVRRAQNSMERSL